MVAVVALAAIVPFALLRLFWQKVVLAVWARLPWAQVARLLPVLAIRSIRVATVAVVAVTHHKLAPVVVAARRLAQVRMVALAARPRALPLVRRVQPPRVAVLAVLVV